MKAVMLKTVAFCAAMASASSFAAPASAVWVGGDSSAPNDPTVLANWAADSSGTALSGLPVRQDPTSSTSPTRVTNNVASASNMIIVEEGMTLNGNIFYIGTGSGASGKVKITGGTFNSGNLTIGQNGAIGELEQTGGTVKVQQPSGWHSAIGSAGTGTVTVVGGSFSVNSNNDTFWFGTGTGGVGTLNVGGDGQVSLQNTYIGCDDNSANRVCNGYLNVYDNGKLSMNTLNVSYGRSNNQRGTVVQSGGTVSTAGNQTIGRNGGATYTQTGGTNTANGIVYVSYGNRVKASYAIGGGELFANEGIILGQGSSYQSNEGGELTLNEGGVVTAKYIQRGNATNNHYARVVCNGGKLVAKGNHSTWLKNLEFTYNAGGVTIDTKTYTVTATNCTTYSSAAEGSAVHKTGTGTLKYFALPLVDEIAVEEGTMAIVANASVTSRSANVISVASGAAFDCGGYTLAAQNLSGAGVVSNGTVTVAGTLSPDGTLAFGDATAVTVDGTLELAANETITLGAGSTLDLANATIKPPSGGSSGSWTFAMGGVGSITGTPKVAKGTGYCVEVAADGSSARLYRSGLIILFK